MISGNNWHDMGSLGVTVPLQYGRSSAGNTVSHFPGASRVWERLPAWKRAERVPGWHRSIAGSDSSVLFGVRRGLDN